MAVDLMLAETLLPHDESADDALERAATAWRQARARLETVDVAALSPERRGEYFRLLARIGLWADAKTCAARGDLDDGDDGDGDDEG